MAAPRPPRAHSDGGDAPVSLFLDTDLGTRLALLVAPDTAIRRLKSQVAAEHAAAFPDLGPVAVKSFQVLRKGVLYHLSDSMTVTSAFTRIKGGCFLHAKIAEAAAVTHCCQDTPATDGRRLSQGRVGIHVEKRAKEMPEITSNIASDVLPQGLEGGGDSVVLNNVHVHDAVPYNVLVPSSSQLNTEIKKNEAVSLAGAQAGSDPVIDKAKSYSRQIKHANQTEDAFTSFTTMANVDKSSNQSNMSHVVEEIQGKEDILHGDGDHNVGGVVSGNKQVRIEEEMLEEIHAVADLPQQKECKKAKRAGSFDTSAADPIRITSGSDTRDIAKSSRAPQETNTTHGEHSNTSFQQEVHGNVDEVSIQKESPRTVGKKEKKRRQLAPPKTVSTQETTKPSTGAVELSKSTGDQAYTVELTGRDEAEVRASDLPLSSSELNGGIQGPKDVEFVSDAQASTDLISEQENFDHVRKGYKNHSMGDVITSTAEVVVTEGKTTKGSNAPWDGGEKHEEIKQHKHNEGSHDGVAETSNVEKDDKSTYTLEKRHRNDNISQEKKRRKAKKVSSVDMASMDTADEKKMHGYRENAAKSGTVSTEREIVHYPSMRQISNNVLQGDSNSGDGKRKKKRRRQSESLKGVDPSQNLTKSSGFVMDESSIQHTNAAHLDAKQTTQGSIEGATVIDQKMIGGSLDIVAANVIDELLTDLRSKDSLSKDLDGDMLTEQTHLGNNQNALELPESTGDKASFSAALPPKYPAAIHSDAPVSSPRHKKSKGKQVKVLSTMIDSSHYSSAVPEEDANTELKESDSLRFSDKTSEHNKDSLTGDVIAQADDKTKATKRQRKKVSLKQVPTDTVKATQSSDEQAKQVATEELKGANATQADLVQGGSIIDTPSGTVGKVQQKGKRSSKTRTPKIQETNHSTHGQDSHLAKDYQDKYVIGITGAHGNENAEGAPAELPVVQEDAMTLKSASPNARKERNKSSKTELQNWDSAPEHGSSADLVNLRAEKCMVSPKNSADAVEPNYHIVIHPASDEINFLDHFSSSKMNDPSVSAKNKQNNEDETTREVKNKKNKRKQDTGSTEPNDLPESLPTDKISLTDYFDASEVVVPIVTEENMNRKYENVKNGKEKKKRKRKPNLEGPAAEKENTNCDNQGSDIGTQDSLLSVVQKGRMGQDNGKESNNKVTQSSSIMQHDPEDATCVRTLEKKLHRSDVDGQNILPIDKDHAHISKEGRKSTSQTKPHAIKGRVGPNPKAVSNLVKSFSMSPPASSDSTEGTPQNANRYRVAVRKVPRKRYEQSSEKSKKESRKVGSSAIFNDAISEGSDDALDTKSKKAAMEKSSDNSSTSADSGISSAAYDESDVPDDDGTLSLSQKSLKEGLHIGSILRGSSSYKKARQKQTELLDDVTEVPDSQPADGLWDRT
ncbi:uncharacterized protein LOC133924447 isoform X2 [Phragmites australis]|uniref:uncharacterized protein LOC133924447 isoform X2 n=1 Tax=Phragmites australis TaxID=29695 RepID=UPI002D781134|nr:uncharacterized protein LOC133924447 isoform X2 [Phragmites australis]